MQKNLPTILIPGLGTSPRTYSPVITELWKHSSVSIANQTNADSMEKMASSILASAPEKFALIGHSMGGYIAFEILRQAKDRVAKLALMNTSARADNEEASNKRKKQIERVKQGDFAGVITDALPNFLHPAHKEDRSLKEVIISAHHDAGAEAYIRQQTAIMNRTDSRPLLQHIDVPTMVLTGDSDLLIAIEFSREIVNAVKSAELVIIPNSGHMAALEQPKAVSHALSQWLEG